MKTIVSMRNYHTFYNNVVKHGEVVPVDGVDTIEIVDAHVILRNVRDRIVTNRNRKMNIGFAIAEWVGMMTGYGGLDLFTPYVHDYAKYSSDGVNVDDAYGVRLAKVGEKVKQSQIDRVIAELKRSSTSRRAVMSIYDGADDLLSGSKNTPCTLTLQFLIRNERLLMITNMRSNDVIKGFTYDVFMFTMLQEYIARQLGVEPGSYFHNAASLHVYLPDAMRYGIMPSDIRWALMMKPMPLIEPKELFLLRDILVEPVGSKVTANTALLSPYMKNLAFAAMSMAYRRTDMEAAKRAYNRVHDSTIRQAIAGWLGIPRRVDVVTKK